VKSRAKLEYENKKLRKTLREICKKICRPVSMTDAEMMLADIEDRCGKALYGNPSASANKGEKNGL
jgi:hypothetical protein